MEEKKLTGYPSIDKPWLKYYSEEALHAPLPQCTVFELLWNNNKDHLGDTALNYYGRKITYEQLFAGIERAAKAFSALGVKAGEIVVVCTVNTPEMVYAFYALNRLGAIANMVDPRTNVDGLRGYILESDAKLVMVVEPAYPAIIKAVKGTNVENIIVVSPADSLPPVTKLLHRMKNKAPKFGHTAMNWYTFEARGAEATPENISYKKDSCCVMAHTGGTTGFPKGVMLSNDNLNAVTHGYGFLGIPFERKQSYFNDLPPFIMYGLCLATHTTLCYGLEVILYPIFDSKGFPKQFAKYKPQHFSALVDHLRYLTIDKRTRNLDLRFLISPGVGGDAVDTTLEKEVNQYLSTNNCEFEICKGYGMTELSATAVITFKGANAIGSVGIPLVVNTMKIVDPDTMKELGYNQTGEIWINGPSIMLGYYKMPNETSELIFTDDKGIKWVRTGDLGHITEDGLLFHEGRIRRIYMTAYEGQPAKIFPMLVEDVLKKSPSVSECSVVGRKRANSDYYEAVAFVVKTNAACEEEKIKEELASLCTENLPTYMVPSQYCFIEQIPHTPIGKVDFRALEREAQKEV